MTDNMYGWPVKKLITSQTELGAESLFEAAMMLHVLEVLYDDEKAGGTGLTEEQISTKVRQRMGIDMDGNLLQ